MKFNEFTKTILNEKIKTDDDMDSLNGMLKKYKPKGYAESDNGSFEFTVGKQKVEVNYEYYNPSGYKDILNIMVNGNLVADDDEIVLVDYLPNLIEYLEKMEVQKKLKSEIEMLERKLAFSIVIK